MAEIEDQVTNMANSFSDPLVKFNDALSKYKDTQPIKQEIPLQQFTPTSKQESIAVSSLDKQAKLKEKLLKKEQEVTWKTTPLTEALIVDGDSINVSPNGNRLSSDKGYSIDTYESWGKGIDLETSQGRKKFFKQQMAASVVLNKDRAEVTLEDIIGLGLKGKQATKDVLFEGQSSNPTVQYSVDGKGKFKRDLTKYRNPVTGKLLGDVLNTPELNANYYSKYNAAKRLEVLRNNPTPLEPTFQESIKDGIISVAKNAPALGKAAYGLVDALSVGAGKLAGTNSSISNELNKLGLLPDFDSLTEGMTKYQSPYLQESIALAQSADANFNKDSKERLAKDRKKYPKVPEQLIQLNEFLKGVQDSVITRYDTPDAALDSVISSIGFLGLSGATGKASQEAVAKFLPNITAKLTEAGAKKLTTALSASRVGEAAALATTGLTEGASSFTDAQKFILESNPKLLRENSEEFNTLEKKYGTEEAQVRLANNKAMSAALANGLQSVAVSKLTGAGKFEGNIGTTSLGKNLLGKVKGFGSNVGKEFVEELGQSASGSIEQNRVEQATNKNKSLLEGTGTAAGAGAVAGALSAGLAPIAISGATTSVAAAKAALKSTKEIKASVAKAKEQVKASESGNVTKIQDPIRATEALVKYANNKDKPISQKGKDKVFKQVNTLLSDVITKIETKSEAADVLPEGSKEQLAVEDEILKLFEQKQKIEAIAPKFLNNQTATVKEAKTLIKNIIEGTTDTLSIDLNTLYSSPESVSPEDIDSIIKTRKDLPEKDITKLMELRSFAERINTKSGVKDDVLSVGSERFPGMLTHERRINQAIDTSEAATSKRLVSFIKFIDLQESKLNLFKNIAKEIQADPSNDSTKYLAKLRAGMLDRNGGKEGLIPDYYDDGSGKGIQSIANDIEEELSILKQSYRKSAVKAQTAYKDIHIPTSNIKQTTALKTPVTSTESPIKEVTADNVSKTFTDKLNLIKHLNTKAPDAFDPKGNQGKHIAAIVADTPSKNLTEPYLDKLIAGQERKIATLSTDSKNVLEDKKVPTNISVLDGITHLKTSKDPVVTKIAKALNTIGITDNVIKENTGSTKALLHEISKIAIQDYVTNNSRSGVVRSLERVEDSIKNEISSNTDKYGKEGTDFINYLSKATQKGTGLITYTLTKPSFQNILKSIPVSENNTKPVLNTVSKLIKKVLGIANIGSNELLDAVTFESIKEEQEIDPLDWFTKEEENSLISYMDKTSKRDYTPTKEAKQLKENTKDVYKLNTSLFERTRTKIVSGLGTLETLFKPKELTGELSVLQTEPEFFNNIVDDGAYDTFKEKYSITKEQDIAFKYLKKYRDDFVNVFLSTQLDADVSDKDVIKSIAHLFSKPKDGIYNLYNSNSKSIKHKHESFDDNFLSAIAVATHNWITTAGSKTLVNYSEDINSILQRDGDTIPTEKEKNLLSNVGMVGNVLKNSIGKNIYTSLGIELQEDTSGHIKSNMIQSLGNIAVSTMLMQGTIKQHNIKNSELDKFRATPSKSPDAHTIFYRIDSKKVEVSEEIFKQEVSDKLRPLVLSVKNTETFLSKLFKTEYIKELPSTVKPSLKNIVKTVKGSGKQIDKRVRKAMLKYSSHPILTKQGHNTVLTSVPIETVYKLFGVKKLDNTHVSNLVGKESTNNSIIRDVDTYFEHTKTLSYIAEPFYILSEMWQSGRFGMVGKINTQASKIHRHLYNYKDNTVTIDTKESRNQFKLAIAEGLGLKDRNNKGVDKSTEEWGVEAFDEFFTVVSEDRNIIESGIKAVKEILDGKVTPTNINALEAAVELGGELSFTFDALMAMSQYHPTDSFEANISREADGITNGPTIGIHLLSGADSVDEEIELLESAGISENVNSNYAENQADKVNGLRSSYDLYEKVTALTESILNNLVKAKFTLATEPNDIEHVTQKAINKSVPNAAERLKVFTGLQLFVGDLKDELGNISKAGRAFSKNETTILNFGSALFNVRQKTVDKMLQKVYDTIEDNFDNEDKLKDISQALSDIVGSSINISKADALKFVLPFKDQKIFESRADSFYAAPLGEAVSDIFKPLIDRRTVYNNALNLVHAIFNIRLDKAIRKATNARTDALKKSGVVIPNHEYSLTEKEFEAVIAELAPSMASVATVTTTSIENEALLTKRESTADYSEKYLQRSYLSKGNTLPIVEGYKPTHSVASYGYITTFAFPSVGGVIKLIHSFDGSVQVSLMEGDTAALNVHDANYFNLKEVKKGSELQNKVYWENAVKYDLGKAILATTTRAIKEANKYGIDEEVIDNILANPTKFGLGNSFLKRLSKKEITDYKGELINNNSIPLFTNLDHFMYSLEKNVKEATDIKAEVTKRIRKVSQYGGDSATGTFKPTYETAKDGLKSVVKEHFKVLKNKANADTTKLTQIQKSALKALYIKGKEQGLTNTDIAKDANTIMGTTKVPTTLRKLSKLGSKDSSVNLNLDTFDTKGTPILSETLSKQNTESIFDKLGSLDSKNSNVEESVEHSNYLKSVLKELINPVVDSLTLKVRELGTDTFGSFLIKDKTVLLNVGKNTSLNDSAMSSKETYIHELLHGITASALEDPKNFLLVKKVKRLYNAVSKNISVDTFMGYDSNGNKKTKKDYPEEYKTATKRYNSIFGSARYSQVTYINNVGKEVTEAKSAALHEFIAFGGSNELFIKELSKLEGSKVDNIIGDSLYETFFNLLQTIINTLTSKIKGTDYLKADKQLMSLIKQVSEINERRQNNITSYSFGFSPELDTRVSDILKTAYKPVSAIINSSVVKASSVAILSPVVSILRRIPTTRFKVFRQVMAEAALELKITEKNVIAQLALEMLGATDNNVFIHRALRSSKMLIDQLRKDTKDTLASHLLTYFVDTPPTKEETKAIGRVVLDTAMYSLSDKYTNIDLEKLLEDTTYLKTELIKTSKELNKFTHKAFYRNYSKSLANKMINGQHLHKFGLNNPYLIAKLAGTELQADEDVSVQEEIISRLTTLEALSLIDKGYKDTVLSVLKRENKISVDNGITFVIQNHEASVKDVLNNLLEGDKIQEVYGYTAETFDPAHKVIIASSIDQEYLASKGYIKKDEYIRDSSDTRKGKLYVYVSEYGMKATWNKTVASFSNRQAVDARIATMSTDESVILESIREQKHVQNITEFNKVTFNNTENVLEPIFDSNINIIGYRYVMNEEMKRNYLDKNYAFNTALGSMESNVVDINNSEKVNSNLVNILYDNYKETFEEDPNMFVFIGKTSKDREYKEIYTLLPPKMKEDIYKTFGQEGMYVHRSIVKVAFGNRKWSVSRLTTSVEADMANVSASGFKQIELFLGDILNTKKGRLGEAMWQELITMVKDTIVIKTGTTLYGNVVSNNWLLWMKGLSVKDIGLDQAEGYTAIKEYLKENHELQLAERTLAVNTKLTAVDKLKLENKIKFLKVSLSSNPMKPLIDKGIFQTIVEDVDLNEKDYSFVDKLQLRTKPYTDSIPKELKILGSNIAMTHDTQLYKAAKDATQLSDLVARYALHKYNLSKGMNEEKSIQDIEDTFINYDLPSSDILQYANDMGLIMFTKFYLRIQKIIYQTYKNAPARALSMFALEGLVGNIPSIDDSVKLPFSMVNLNPIDTASNIVEVPAKHIIID